MSDTLYSSCPSHPAQGACRGCALEDADHLIRKRLEAFKGADLATRVAADLFVDNVHPNDSGFAMYAERLAAVMLASSGLRTGGASCRTTCV
jgi:hypothetical protein